MTPEVLRGKVVLRVLAAIIALCSGLYLLIGILALKGVEIPEALWLAAGMFGGSLTGWLLNSKGTSGPEQV